MEFLYATDLLMFNATLVNKNAYKMGLSKILLNFENVDIGFTGSRENKMYNI